MGSPDDLGGGCASPGGSAPLALVVPVVLTAVIASLAACLPRGHVEVPAQPRASGDLATLLPGAQLARSGGADADDGDRLGDTPAPADDDSRLHARLCSETGLPHINDVAQRIRYNGAYFEIDIEVNGERGIVPVVWDMLRAHTPLVDRAYYARVYTSRGWANGLQVPNFGPEVILPEAFTPELTPVIFDYFRRSFIDWNRNFDGWTRGMAETWMKTAAITVARAWTPEYVGGVAVAGARASMRASQIRGQMALGAAAVPNAAAATRACSGGRCPCFVAGTPVATADGPIVIERVAVGQRVLPASPACDDFTAADAAALTRYDLQIRTTDGDVFVVELLRPREWPYAPGARPGDAVYVELDELNVRGPALVTARDPRPSLDEDSRRGCAVTATIRHTAKTLSVLRLEGDDEPIIATPWHRMYSHTHDDWVAIEDLTAGELLRTADGAIAVESVIALRDRSEPVFNLEVAGSHRYFVHGRRVLTHNTYGSASGGGKITPGATTTVGVTVDDVLAGSVRTNPGRLRVGRAARFERSGGFHQANVDFEGLNPSKVVNKGGGVRVGHLPDGRIVVVRPGSTQGLPTLEIQGGANPIKIRFTE